MKGSTNILFISHGIYVNSTSQSNHPLANCLRRSELTCLLITDLHYVLINKAKFITRKCNLILFLVQAAVNLL